MDNKVTYSIGELAKQFDITTRSIRFYEDEGLLSPRRQGQQRIYTNKDRVRLKLILRGKRLGFSLAETGRLFESYDADNSSAAQLQKVLELIGEKKLSLKQQMEDINVLLTELSGLEQRCQDELKTISSSVSEVHSQESL